MHYEYSTRATFCPAIGQHNILLRCLPAETASQHIRSERFVLSEGFWYKEELDGFGNRVIVGGTSNSHDTIIYSSCGVIDTTTYCIPDPEPHPMFFLPSAQTQVSREMLTLLPRRLSGNVLDDCLRIVHALHSYIIYTPGITTVNTTAADAYRLRKGVCQDYAHLMIALCRAIGIPARYVCGLMMGEGATHAWVEVHDGQCWYAFDPTNDTAVASGYIKLAHGRDALDCPVNRGTYIGVASQQTYINVKVRQITI